MREDLSKPALISSFIARSLGPELTSPKTWLISGEVMKSPLRPKTSCLISARIFDCA
jgi:hypothetical protein